MSAFDDLFADLVSTRADDGSVSTTERDLRRIGAALDAARAGEGRPLPENYTLPDYPGQTSELRVGGVGVGSHGLTFDGGGDEIYVADLDIDGGALLPLCIERRRLLRAVTDERAAAARFGPVQALGVKAFDKAFTLRCKSKALGVAVLANELLVALSDVKGDLVDVVVTPLDGKSRVQVRVRVDGARNASSAIAVARAAWKAASAVAPRAAGFVAAADKKDVDGDDIKRMLEKVRDATSYLSGSIERVGNGVEARFDVEEPTALQAALRVDVDGESASLRVHFRGALPVPPERPVKLSPEVGVLKKALGLLDPKVGDEALDRAFLIEGDVDTARLVLAEPAAALRLAGRGAVLEANDAGFHVDVAAVAAADDVALLEIVAACIAAWREVMQKTAGFAT